MNEILMTAAADSDACIARLENVTNAVIACTKETTTCEEADMCALLFGSLDDPHGPCHTGEPVTTGEGGEGGGEGGQGGSPVAASKPGFDNICL